MSKTDLVYLKHMLDAIMQIEEYLEDVSSENFLGVKLTQDGVIRQLEILGEASNQISDSTKQAHPQVPWGQIIGLRNRLIHAYFSINLWMIWEITEIDLPPLKTAVTQIIHNFEHKN